MLQEIPFVLGCDGNLGRFLMQRKTEAEFCLFLRQIPINKHFVLQGAPKKYGSLINNEIQNKKYIFKNYKRLVCRSANLDYDII